MSEQFIKYDGMLIARKDVLKAFAKNMCAITGLTNATLALIQHVEQNREGDWERSFSLTIHSAAPCAEAISGAGVLILYGEKLEDRGGATCFKRISAGGGNVATLAVPSPITEENRVLIAAAMRKFAQRDVECKQDEWRIVVNVRGETIRCVPLEPLSKALAMAKASREKLATNHV